ncbi:RNA polymerase primary sigma factor [Bradyrhizobium lablabi]|uniref:RNA polymerase primary sigma factor n=1 Tax=Bradyrhizobium lablabi TaxID=722472 RepID=A0A1M6Q4L2_9BRAD|nr:sigma-70 family RNA polymerase sigma factor [Bradyrhizobium lablabi]SHK15063.1 RNA polymerase primary sigma factor [Bradyrhizobium lablabi]
MLQANPRPELELVRAVVSGDAAAAQRFLEMASATLWSVVVKLEGDGAEGESAFLGVIEGLKADGYSRLRAFDGRSRLSTYLAIVARDILADRLARGFVESPRKSWTRFERFFGEDIRRRVAHRFPRETGTGRREDAYQEVCLKFIEDDYRRIRAYDGLGSFTGFILTVAERILLDLVRRDAPRRRLPAAVARLSQLDQDIYAAIVWGMHPVDADRLAMTMRGRFERDPDAEEIRQALQRVAEVAPLTAAATSGRSEMVSLDTSGDDDQGIVIPDSGATPEQQLLDAEEEQTRSALLDAVKQAADDLPADERLYLQIVFSATDPMPAREIARTMQLPVEDVYRLKQRAQRWLTELAARLGKKDELKAQKN